MYFVLSIPLSYSPLSLSLSPEVRCPSQQVDDWKFPQTARHNITGFNLVRRFSLLKTAMVKKIRNPRGPVILRLGKTALIHPTEYVPSLSLTTLSPPLSRPPSLPLFSNLIGPTE
ncbi:unnamed protein product [Coregonus sp. 'balchen']|nr:unnamed protein product [Coregonus sp. 'balchen']